MRPIKWILIDSNDMKRVELRCGFEAYHKFLIHKDDRFNPRGGGLVEIVHLPQGKLKLVLYDESGDFGHCNDEDFKPNPHVKLDLHRFIEWLFEWQDLDESYKADDVYLEFKPSVFDHDSKGIDLTSIFKQQYNEVYNLWHTQQ